MRNTEARHARNQGARILPLYLGLGVAAGPVVSRRRRVSGDFLDRNLLELRGNPYSLGGCLGNTSHACSPYSFEWDC